MKLKLSIALLCVASAATVVAFAGARMAPITSDSPQNEYPKLLKPKVKLVDWEDEIIEGVKKFESFRSTPYRCPAGVLTVGYGYTGKGANRSVTVAEAERLLHSELDDAANIVDRNVRVKLTEWQRAALISFTFNCGEKNLKSLVNGAGRLNNGNYESVSRMLPKYMYANGKPLRGLSKRRGWEVEVWNGIFTA
jgi:lysozyme